MKFYRILSILLNFIFFSNITCVHIIVNNINAHYVYPIVLAYPIINLYYGTFLNFFESANKTLDVK